MRRVEPASSQRPRAQLSFYGRLMCCLLLAWCRAFAQNPVPEQDSLPPAPQSQSSLSPPRPVPLKALPKNLFVDQAHFLTSPLHMNEADWEWGVPLVLAGAGLVASDQSIENHVPTNSSLVPHAVTASNAGLAAMAGAGTGLFLLGHLRHDDQERETGLLSGEAALDAVLDSEVFLPLGATGPSRVQTLGAFSTAAIPFHRNMQPLVSRSPASSLTNILGL